MQELKRFQEKYPKAFEIKSAVLPKSSFSLLSPNDRKELSTVYFNLAKVIVRENDIMTEITEENKLRALDYLNASISLDFKRNKGIYSMIAKLYAAINNQIGAYANALIAVELGEISHNDEFFVKQCEKMNFPTPKYIIRINDNNLLNFIIYIINFNDNFCFTDIVLILEPGTYDIITGLLCEVQNIVIIGIGEVTIKGPLIGINCNFMLYNIHVEYTKSHSLDFDQSKVFMGNCQFTKCCHKFPPICISGHKASLFMNECLVANSESAGGILINCDSKAYIKNCEIRNVGVSAIEVRYGSSLIAEKNHIHHNNHGVVVWRDANEVRLIDNIIQNNHSEGILINGNREPSLSKKVNAGLRQFLYEPPPSATYSRPLQTTVKMQKNKVLQNGSFGVSVDFQANIQMEENEIANNGGSGCIIKGGVDASFSNNIVHHNGSYGIEIGLNYNGKVVVENNHIHSNIEENIIDLAHSELNEIEARELKVNVRQLGIPAKLINNKFGNYGSNNQDFVNFNVSSNRSGIHLFYEEQPYLYAIGNTYGFNLLKKSHKVIPETLSVFLGGIGDLRNIVETVHGLTKSLESHTNKDRDINLLFTINDFNPVILARDLVLLKMISNLPDPKPPFFENVESPYGQWNKDFVAGAIQVLSIWAEKSLNPNAFHILNDCINSLIESLENIVNNKIHNTKKPPPWILFKYSSITAFSILQTLKYWKEKSYASAALNWRAKQQTTFKNSLREKKLIPKPDINMLKNLMEKYSNTDEDIDKYVNCRLPISIQATSCDQKNKEMYSETRRNGFNLTMFTVPTMEDNVYPTSCIFRAFQVTTDPSQYEDQHLTLYDHLLLTLLPKFASLRASLCETSSVQIQVIPILGDIVDTLLCQLPLTVKFNAVDCSNIADYASLLNILLAAAPRLKDNSPLTLQLMRLGEVPAKPIEKFIEERFGISLDVFARLTGITIVNAYYQDYAVYTTWKFDVTCKDYDKEKKPEILMMDVISIAAACCAEHTKRVKGLSINILVRLFQIMIARFSENTMIQLLQLLFSPEGFKKHIPKFAMHLIELKVFMMLHLPQSMIFKIEEFEDFKKGSIARYNVRWITDKMGKAEILTKEWYMNRLRREVLFTTAGAMSNEEVIWLKLIKPTSNGNNARKRKKKGNGSNTNKQQTCYYFDSVSLNAVNAPVITVSFHLPISFYDIHKDWVLECIVGSVKILDVARKITLSEAKQESLYHDTWVGVSNNTKDNDESENNKGNLCKQCGRTRNSTGGGFCSKCKLVFYCSKDCQIKHWRRHKMECADASGT